MMTTVLGGGGFIGSHLCEALLDAGHRVNCVDHCPPKIQHLIGRRWFVYTRADALAARETIEMSDLVIHLAAICNPSQYNTNTISTITSNYSDVDHIVRQCSLLNKRLIYFSTCEVYGKSGEGGPLSEDTSQLLLGPVSAERWSYATAKALSERLVYAYGRERGLQWTIVRPFNVIGPRMDYIPGLDGEGIPRVIACFMDSLLNDKALRVVDGGGARRTFCYIDDLVDAVVKMVNCPESVRQIFNIGNPDNEISMAALAAKMIAIAGSGTMTDVSAKEFYGPGYEDSPRRIPDISKAQHILGWTPTYNLHDTLQNTMAWFFSHYQRGRTSHGEDEHPLGLTANKEDPGAQQQAGRGNCTRWPTAAGAVAERR